MEQPQIGAYSKEQIYEAYLIEYLEKIRLNSELKRLQRKLAEVRYDDKEYLIDVVTRHVAVVGDKQQALKDFFNHDYHIVRLRDGGVMAYIEEHDHYFMAFVYTANSLYNAKIVYNTTKALSKKKPVLYTGVKDFYKNNSIEVEDGVYLIQFGE